MMTKTGYTATFDEFVASSDELYEMLGIPVPNDAGLMQAYRQLFLVKTPEIRNNYFHGQGYPVIRGNA